MVLEARRHCVTFNTVTMVTVEANIGIACNTAVCKR